MSIELNGYDLSRKWFEFCFENPEQINPNHGALYFFAVEQCNRFGWANKFGFPSSLAMQAIGIKSYKTYKKTLSELIDFGFVEMIQESKNQYTANIIALVKNTKALSKALSKASTNHLPKHYQSTVQSKDTINKLVNNKPLNNKHSNSDFDKNELNVPFTNFWDLYDKKKGQLKKIERMWLRLSDEERSTAMDHIPKYKVEQPDKQFRKNPETYLNNKSFNDEIIINEKINGHSTPKNGSARQTGFDLIASRVLETTDELEFQ